MHVNVHVCPCYTLCRALVEEQLKLDELLAKLSSVCRIFCALINIRNKDLRSNVSESALCISICSLRIWSHLCGLWILIKCGYPDLNSNPSHLRH